MKLETGGPAFPTIPYATGMGMTLLDYFAGQALASGDAAKGANDANDLVTRCYAFAQLMLTERKRLEAEAKELPSVG